MKSPQTFHTQSNLSATLYGVCMQHYSSIPKSGETPITVPEFVSEGIHIICQNMAKLMNEDFSDLESWENIEEHAKVVKEIFTNNQGKKDVES